MFSVDANTELSNGFAFQATVVFNASHQPGQILNDIKRQISEAGGVLGQSVSPNDILVFGAPA